MIQSTGSLFCQTMSILHWGCTIMTSWFQSRDSLDASPTRTRSRILAAEKGSVSHWFVLLVAVINALQVGYSNKELYSYTVYTVHVGLCLPTGNPNTPISWSRYTNNVYLLYYSTVGLLVLSYIASPVETFCDLKMNSFYWHYLSFLLNLSSDHSRWRMHTVSAKSLPWFDSCVKQLLLVVHIEDGIRLGGIVGWPLLTSECWNSPKMRPPIRPSINTSQLASQSLPNLILASRPIAESEDYVVI